MKIRSPRKELNTRETCLGSLLRPEEYKLFLREDPSIFIEAAFRDLNPDTLYIPGPHIDLIADKLKAVAEGKIRRLIVQLPPRQLKSHCVSVAFPAWLLGLNPAKRIICVSYGQELAEKMARDTRALMTSDWYKSLFPATRIADRQAVHDFETTASGGRMATSTGGVLTGRGADVLILDDPLKPEDALSETLRTGVNSWFDNTLLSRLNNKETGCIIIVMQRLHQDDLIGHVLDRDEWDVLSFPAITQEKTTHIIEDIFGRREVSWEPGSALHPQREPLEVLLKIRSGMGEYNFSSQYQQNPLPLSGNIIRSDWLNFYERGSEPARFHRILQSWDTANKAGELNDYSVCTTWGVKDGKYYLLDVFRARLNFPDLKRKVIELAQRWRPNTVLVEDKASGTQLIQELREYGLNIKAYEPSSKADKAVRLHAQSAAFENGRVLLPSKAPWLTDYLAEVTGFPGTKFADQVDSTTQFLDFIGSCPTMVITEEVLRMSRIPTKWGRRRKPLVPWVFR